MAKQVIWSQLAQKDRKAILDFWINYTKSYAYSKRLNQIFENTAELISKHPKIGKNTEIQDVRIKIVKDYYFTYRESETRIEILTIWDSRQDPKNFNRILK
ncbi:MAG TPA: type II toxin-antitoxin system RelE/ParE family toxin [Prolixibacteraceae bacterium]|nr:type II toxin-antitoxin system RelE/ParE family toxin [Prolixibacteraceae bacterium]